MWSTSPVGDDAAVEAVVVVHDHDVASSGSQARSRVGWRRPRRWPCSRRSWPCSGDVEHPLERDPRPLGGVRVDGDLVHDLAPRPVTRAPTRGAGRRCGTWWSTGRSSGSSDTTVRSGCSCAIRCTMWISVPTPSTEPGAAPLDPVEDALGGADPVGELDDVVRALGVHDHLTVGVLGAERGDVLGPEALVHRAVPLPEQEGRFLHVALLEAAELEARVPHPHGRRRRSPCRSAVLRPRCWSGKKSTLVAPGRAPIRGRPARSTTCTPRRRARPRTP